MPKRYVLEVVLSGSKDIMASFTSAQPFSAFAKGDKLVLVGEGGALLSHAVEGVEHTIWQEGSNPVHKTQVSASRRGRPA